MKGNRGVEQVKKLPIYLLEFILTGGHDESLHEHRDLMRGHDVV
jgi:hypothetical protein